MDIPDVPEAPAGERVGHRHDALPVILAMQDMKDAAGCVNILQAQRQCFGNAQPAAIQHPEQQWIHEVPVRGDIGRLKFIKTVKDGCHFLTGKNIRHMFLPGFRDGRQQV